MYDAYIVHFDWIERKFGFSAVSDVDLVDWLDGWLAGRAGLTHTHRHHYDYITILNELSCAWARALTVRHKVIRRKRMFCIICVYFFSRRRLRRGSGRRLRACNHTIYRPVYFPLLYAYIPYMKRMLIACGLFVAFSRWLLSIHGLFCSLVAAAAARKMEIEKHPIGYTMNNERASLFVLIMGFSS